MPSEGYRNGSQGACSFASDLDGVAAVGEIDWKGIGIEALAQEGEIGSFNYLHEGDVSRPGYGIRVTRLEDHGIMVGPHGGHGARR